MCAILYFFLMVCNKPHANPTIIYENIKEIHILAVGGNLEFPILSHVLLRRVIYVMRCAGCGLEYIGETGDLRKRVTVHNQQIRDPRVRVLKVSAHIDACASSCTPKYHILPLYKMNKQSALARRDKETYFIQKFKPALNSKI